MFEHFADDWIDKIIYSENLVRGFDTSLHNVDPVDFTDSNFFCL